MTDLEELPVERCASYRDPFDLIGQCPNEGVHFHLGVRWCGKHYEEIKAAELRAVTRANEGLATRIL